MDSTLISTPWFTAQPCRDCDIPGYFVLQPRAHATRLSELSLPARETLGIVLGELEEAIQSVTGAEHVYTLRFSEGLSAVHFHLFPPTRKMASEWLAVSQSTDVDIIGPTLFAWARVRFWVNGPDLLSRETLRTAELIGEAFESRTEQGDLSPSIGRFAPMQQCNDLLRAKLSLLCSRLSE